MMKAAISGCAAEQGITFPGHAALKEIWSSYVGDRSKRITNPNLKHGPASHPLLAMPGI
ncbi:MULTISPECIES: hypothetical protein [unclassified Agrobacterium]|uniref:hypothetical protein n=1 Tax=unclassified Agrobacterium TaxID=2632611 RepID=UPI00244963E3|nr:MULTISPECIES: hypothetical protein [unclassified Agrobacterium]MDH0611964.1 hypothetical protein [Agrobacterium sp. GD03872]MDH0695861.1 hypothetical protein [Agrobacterium sp. GD03871]MDH1058865.1 hypothetical protein [Agrobacterium sp. GD03992]MDH2210956.1 hypothetical protein [Agrobacterium sp. GD03643]MDH2217627.1 hypothetical protein [Agrobacterium sp. GD03638]